MDENEQRVLRIKKKKRKRLLFSLFLILLIGGLTGGYILAVKYREKKETKLADEKEAEENKPVEMYQISDYTFYVVSSIEYTNQENSYFLYKTKTDNGNVWRRKGDESFPIKNEKILFIIGSFCNMMGTTRIPGETADLEEYGIKDSKITVKITLDSGETQSFRFGNKAPYEEGYYLLDEKSGDVFIVDQDIYYELSTKEIDLVEPGDLPKIAKEQMKQITIQKKGEKAVIYRPESDAEGKLTYPEIFFNCESFIATKLEAFRSPDYSVYGLDPAEVVLTIDYTETLPDEDGNPIISNKQTMIEFGFMTESGNTYIRANKNDFVFIMTAAHVDKYVQ